MRVLRKIRPSLLSILKREQSGYDAGKIATDKIGCLLAVVTHRANQHDTKIGIWVATFAFFIYSTIKKFCADGG